MSFKVVASGSVEIIKKRLICKIVINVLYMILLEPRLLHMFDREVANNVWDIQKIDKEWDLVFVFRNINLTKIKSRPHLNCLIRLDLEASMAIAKAPTTKLSLDNVTMMILNGDNALRWLLKLMLRLYFSLRLSCSSIYFSFECDTCTIDSIFKSCMEVGNHHVCFKHLILWYKI